MALRLVNTAPGESTEQVKPRQLVHLGLKSETLKVPIASTRISMGLTNILFHGSLPEDDSVVQSLVSEVSLETSERRRPIDGITPRTISGGSLHFTKSNLNDGEQGIYEVKMPIKQNASCLAYFKFKTKTAWTIFSADWCNLTNMIGMYFGLEHGTYNTAAYAFLRANTLSGSLIIGGPLQAYNTSRSGQIEVVPGFPHASTIGFPWRSLSDNSIIEIYIYFNTQGYSSPPETSVPINTPLVEIWTKVPSQSAPVVQAYIPVSSLGIFPSSLLNPAFTNSRPGTSDIVTIFFGNISKTSGSDVLELDDWALFPDYRIAVRDGISRPNHNFFAVPDSPVEYNVNKNLLPTELVPGRWFPEIGTEWAQPNMSLFFQPGRRSAPLFTLMEKTESLSLSAIHKTEPRFEELQDGIMIEALLSGESIYPTVVGTGMGFSIEDGDKLYQVLMIESQSQKFFALCKDLSSLDSLNGYHVPSREVNFGSPKLVKLLIDRLRPASIGGGKAQLVIDEELVLTTDLSTDVFPSSSSPIGMVRVGHLALLNAKSRLKLNSINYLPRYLAWEGVDALSPDDVGLNSAIKFVLDSSGSGSHSIVDSSVQIQKTGIGGSTKRLFYKEQSFGEIDGMMVDFKMQIQSYADSNGTSFVPNIKTGVGIDIHLGNKVASLGFYDCGAHGRVVALLPSNEDIEEIINQTDLGKSLSAKIDWTQENSFRLIIKGRDRIDLIIGSPLNPSSITLEWIDDTNGFDLPESASSSRIAFGHLSSDTISKSKWRYVRWGLSNGFEVSVQQEYPDRVQRYSFGGRALIKAEFDEA